DLDSHNDWRLPNIKELASIVDLSCAYPAINQKMFPDTGNSEFWTSSVFSQYPQRAWYIKFDLGHDYPADKRYFKQLRLVRLGLGRSSYKLAAATQSSLENACIAFQPANTMVVLIPDSDGHIGEVSVSNDSVTKNLTQPYTLLKVTQSENEIASASRISEAETNNIFSSALAAQPQEEKHFILYFTTGTTSLTSESQEKLAEVFAVIEQSTIIDIYISGHTDTQGADLVNEKLALKRTERVVDLIAQQLTVDQVSNIKSSSHGEGNPLVETADDIAEPLNRRVEITIHL
ncbi:MAG: DUF1566 domain-containing protein, partial [Pseudomonadota bacterium]